MDPNYHPDETNNGCPGCQFCNTALLLKKKQERQNKLKMMNAQNAKNQWTGRSNK